MRVKFRVNIGSQDARKCGVDYKKCTAGETVDVDRKTAIALVEQGIAEAVDNLKAIPEPAAIHAVPPEEESVEKATSDLVAYRDKQRKPKAKSDDAK